MVLGPRLEQQLTLVAAEELQGVDRPLAALREQRPLVPPVVRHPGDGDAVGDGNVEGCVGHAARQVRGLSRNSRPTFTDGTPAGTVLAGKYRLDRELWTDERYTRCNTPRQWAYSMALQTSINRPSSSRGAISARMAYSFLMSTGFTRCMSNPASSTRRWSSARP